MECSDVWPLRQSQLQRLSGDARKVMFPSRLFCRLCLSSFFWTALFSPSKIPALFSERNGFHFFRRKRQILASLNLDNETFADNCWFNISTVLKTDRDEVLARPCFLFRFQSFGTLNGYGDHLFHRSPPSNPVPQRSEHFRQPDTGYCLAPRIGNSMVYPPTGLLIFGTIVLR